MNEWAVRCSCGEFFEFPTEERARKAMELWRHRNAPPPELIHRTITVSDWEVVEDHAAAA